MASLRDDPLQWTSCEYREQLTEDWGSSNANERERHRTLIALQYSRGNEDEPLVRFLFEQEVIARKRDSFQGFGDALRAAAYLLSRYRSPLDLWRFAEAKFANFDTCCGFDPQFLLSAGIASALVVFNESSHPLKEQVRETLFDDAGACRYSQSDLDAWEEWLRDYFPENPANEPAKVWINRAIEFQCLEEGRALLVTVGTDPA